jgi:HlyD family secretion protein
MKKKILIIGGIVLVVAIIVVATVIKSKQGDVTVQTGKVVRSNIASIVTASGEIKPKTFVNVGANAMGRLVSLPVKEGDHVKKGQLVAQLENIQPEADLNATRAGLDAAQSDAAAADAAQRTASADLNRAQADYDQKSLDWQRGQDLFKSQLIPKQEYDSRKAAFEGSASNLEQAKIRIVQTKAQFESAQRHIKQNAATLTHASDVLAKTTYIAPYDGIVTNLPVRQGEMVVMGIQNSPGSTIMTISDMSIVTAEVKVDETDIVNVKLGQPAEVTIDALPKQKFKGTVTEMGDNAILRSSGVSTSQSTGGSQEARDFKVVVTLIDPPETLRPGLSATAKITTATRDNAVTIPIQALTIRQRGDLKEKDSKKGSNVQAASPDQAKADKEELQGVFVFRANEKKAEFVPVETGITGTTDIEVSKGLKEGDEIVTGSYKVLRSLKNGAKVKVDNTAPAKADETS